MPKNYIEKIIDWLRHGAAGQGKRLTADDCGNMADNLEVCWESIERRLNEQPEPEENYCLQPKTHAPGCGCGDL